jgi:hypothetical protein
MPRTAAESFRSNFLHDAGLAIMPRSVSGVRNARTDFGQKKKKTSGRMMDKPDRRRERESVGVWVRERKKDR